MIKGRRLIWLFHLLGKNVEGGFIECLGDTTEE